MAVPCTDMRKHLFLTGEKGVGKSTLLKKLLPDGSVGGFFTVKTEGFSSHPSIHLVYPGEAPCKGNFLFSCGYQSDPGISSRFDRLGCAALNEALHPDVWIMDELGPAEKDAFHFQAAVLRLLNGNIPVIGVLQQADTPFLHEVAKHTRVRVVTVTTQNRDRLALELCHWISDGCSANDWIV